MNSSWSGPAGTSAGTSPSFPQPSSSNSNHNDKTYRALVVDSGPIIKETNVHAWRERATQFYTVPAVVAEIRDSKARHNLQQYWIPLLGLETRVPSTEAMQRVTEFAQLTGDYPSLSAVDLQVLALTLDLEREGCHGSVAHLRTTPKRTIGLGTMTTLNTTTTTHHMEEKKDDPASSLDYDIIVLEDDGSEESEDDEDDGDEGDNVLAEDTQVPTTSSFSWAKLVNPKDGSETVQVEVGDVAVKQNTTNQEEEPSPNTLVEELASEFPSLSASATVPFEGEDEHDDDEQVVSTKNSKRLVQFDDAGMAAEMECEAERLQQEAEERERLKKEALKPISKSGKLYNSFRKYQDLMKPTAPSKKKVAPVNTTSKITTPKPILDEATSTPDFPLGQSRILGSSAVDDTDGIDTMKAEEDDGQGWITSSQHIRVLKNQAGGAPLDPIKGAAILPVSPDKQSVGPSISQRTACTTTDFAMQNVLLQMGLVLLSVDGMQIRRLKSWVLRCGACFKIHTDLMDPKTGLRRMFCSHCGSGDMMQRVSASVDGKTGRLKLYFSKKKQNKHTSARGSKFSLPKPGTGNRFQGDLLLREDQLLMRGAWNQKVRKNGGGQSRAHTESIFGKDIATNVGCGVTSLPNDIQVGFGRRNPNSAKGRERRGKKKKSSDRACGLRRY